MLKLEIEDFLFEIKDEILSYEELGEKKAEEWEKNFRLWLKNDKKKKNLKNENGKIYYLIDDESEIFDIVDEYYDSVEQNREEEYWKKFE